MKRPDESKPTGGEEAQLDTSREAGAKPHEKGVRERHRSYSAPSIPPPRRESGAAAPSVQVDPRSDPRRYTTKRLKRRRAGRPPGQRPLWQLWWAIVVIVVGVALLLLFRWLSR